MSEPKIEYQFSGEAVSGRHTHKGANSAPKERIQSMIHKQWASRLKKVLASLPGWAIEPENMVADEVRKNTHRYMAGRLLEDSKNTVQIGVAHPGSDPEVCSKLAASVVLPKVVFELQRRLPAAKDYAELSACIIGPDGKWCAKGPAKSLVEAADQIEVSIIGQKS
jgi:hypothetical protein